MKAKRFMEGTLVKLEGFAPVEYDYQFIVEGRPVLNMTSLQLGVWFYRAVADRTGRPRCPFDGWLLPTCQPEA